MKFPSVYPLTTPSSQSTIKMIAMVSSIRRLHSLGSPRCNLNAVLFRSIRSVGLAVSLMFLPITVWAQTAADSSPAQPDGITAADTVKFLAGGALAFVTHEGGHLLFDAAFDADARIESVHFGPVPFFAVAHRAGLSPRREFTISSAGFWTQEATSEWLLTRYPDLRHERAIGAMVMAPALLEAYRYFRPHERWAV